MALHLRRAGPISALRLVPGTLRSTMVDSIGKKKGMGAHFSFGPIAYDRNPVASQTKPLRMSASQPIWIPNSFFEAQYLEPLPLLAIRWNENSAQKCALSNQGEGLLGERFPRRIRHPSSCWWNPP